ncbi:hypothetical protein D7X55_07585 [Corallococcus sp. AB049A]|uniref:Uncharacterized protein n=1 Tax=Corallococcus interemptor TaxID=2316720 RepID=A0A3A8QJY6_9BACT|nr:MULTISPECIES: hypothetical protein [Corallococcus]RKH48708.1 hypothetical protein D7Y23_19480 [Corallococcus sp. AB050B]RKH67230.1 hypothetical protein D7X96_19880 [Corallococcus interemptor]RKI72316.1 hypothetical protein D7X55_07585 [Corallococcus sp. AB049A]
MSPKTKPAAREPGLEDQLLLDGVQRLSEETGSAGAPLTPGAVRLRALGTLAKGSGLVLLGAAIMAGLVWVGLGGDGALPILLVAPTYFMGAAYVVAGLTGVLTGRPWDRTSLWVKLPMMIIGSLLVLTAGIAISVVSSKALRSDTDSTPSASE